MTAAAPTTLGLLWALRDLRDARLRAAHRAVLYALVAYRGGDGVITPSTAQIAAAAALGDKQVRRVLHELRDAGHVRIHERSLVERAGKRVLVEGAHSPGDRLLRHLSSRYELVLPCGGVLPSTGVLPAVGVLPSEGVGTPLGGSTGTPSQGRGVLPPAGASEDLSEDLSEDQIADPPKDARVRAPGVVDIERELSPGKMTELAAIYLEELASRGAPYLPSRLDKPHHFALRDALVAIRDVAEGETRGTLGGYAYALRTVIDAWWSADADMRDADFWWPRELCHFASGYMAKWRVRRR